jgi:predicted regulator of Ras-like GTPase activity (Roadblock/LC7/MglB family)
MNVKAFDAIDEILQKIFRAEPGVRKLVLTDYTGNTILHASNSLEYLIDIDEFGAMAGMIFSANEILRERLGLGAPHVITFEFEDAKIQIVTCGEGILSFLTEKNYPVAQLIMANVEHELKELIAQYLLDPIIETIELNTTLSGPSLNAE